MMEYSVVSDIIIYRQTYMHAHLENHGSAQHGFRKLHSTQLINKVHDFVSALNNHDVIMLHMSKAFNIVPHTSAYAIISVEDF